MNILSKALSVFSRKGYSPSSHPTTKEERIFWNGMGPYGLSQATQISAALRAGMVISSGMGVMPVQCNDEGIARLLNTRANDLQTGSELIEMLTLHAVFTGSGRAFVEKKGGKPVEIWPILPDLAHGWVWNGTQDDWVLPVHIPGEGSEREYIGEFTRDRVLEINAPRWDVMRALNVTQHCQDVLGLSKRLQDRQARLSDTNAPYGVLTAKEGTSTDAISKLKKAWSDQFGKTGIAVVDFEAKFTQLMQNASDQQLLETMQFQIEEIGRMYGVHPYMLMKTAGSGAQSAIADIMLFHQVYTMAPWIRRWEMGAQWTLGQAINFDENALLRSTPAQQAENLARALGSGGNMPWMEINEARARVGLPPADWAAGDPRTAMQGQQEPDNET